MEFALFFPMLNALLLLLSSPCKFFQPPMHLPLSNLLPVTNTSSQDFGLIHFNAPSAVLKPHSPSDISLLLTSLSASNPKLLRVAARGAGHSIHGQAQALGGIVIEMSSLPLSIKIHKGYEGETSYADVSAGALWVELLEESLKFGLAPRSWTDYLYLTIGGTLSNAGISGQTFKYGPQISNVVQLDVITGEGELVRCSATESSELFHAVLGGLGQFGIIISARVLLQNAPPRVRWVRAFYEEFGSFVRDQEVLISKPEIVDYVEGFIVLNEQSLHSFSTAFPLNVDFIAGLERGSSKVYYCIEFALHEYEFKESNIEHAAEEILAEMNHMQSHVYIVEVSYFDFLNRVRMEEMSLRDKGLWEVPHPWLNLFVPKSGITAFNNLMMDNISKDDFVGPILIYPFLREKWDANMSAVLPPEETVLYVIGMLQSISPENCSPECLRGLLNRNQRITEAVSRAPIGAKQYLAHHDSQAQWKEHLGWQGWERFEDRKTRFDPFCILSPGQGILNLAF